MSKAVDSGRRAVDRGQWTVDRGGKQPRTTEPGAWSACARRVARRLTVMLVALASTAGAQWLPFGGRVRLPAVEVKPVEGLRQRVHDGKLYLRLDDFIQLVLNNNTEIQVTRLDIANATDAVVNAQAPFDPLVALSFNTLRTVAPQYSQIGGAATLNSLNEVSQLSVNKVLSTGQVFSVGFSGTRASSNSQFAFFNPSINTGLTLGLTQHLMQDRGNYQQRAPLLMARTRLVATTEQTEATVADQVTSAARQYWDAIGARDAVRVQQMALDLAQKSYERDQRALQLGALPKLDIYQSQAQVARNKVSLLQSQSNYRQALDGLRRLIGADLEPQTREIDIVLEDDPSSMAGLTPPPVEQSIAQALRTRPELSAAHRYIAIDAVRERAARDLLRPALDLIGSYGAYGLGGNQVPVSNSLGGPTTTTVATGGLSDALHQMFAFSAPFYGFGLQFSFPMRNSAAQANLTDALVAHARDDYHQRAVQQQIIQDVKNATTQQEMAAAEIDAAKTARDLAQKNVEAEQQKYQLGSTTVFELLQAQQQLSQAENALVVAYTDYQKAVIGYRRATWTLLANMNIVVQPPRSAHGKQRAG